MCIAIAKPAGVKITKKVLKECFENNPDGAGFAYACPDEDKVKIVKGMFTFRSFWEEYRAIDPVDKTVLIHFRVATSGKTDSVNCHPWFIDEKHVLIHNGVLTKNFDNLEHENYSDTGLFAVNVLKPIFQASTTLWKTAAFEWMLEESMGTGNKMVIMNPAGDFKIFNEFLGEWEFGAWFSNKTFKEERKKKKTTTNSAVTTGTYYNTNNHYSSGEDRRNFGSPHPADENVIDGRFVLCDTPTSTSNVPADIIDISNMY